MKDFATMYLPHDSVTAFALCVVTMLCWGSWANTQKIANRQRWPFPFFYWDYGIGVLLTALLALSLFGDSLSGDPSKIARALFSGVIFNVSNLLLVVAIDAAGMAVAFPVGVGLALVIGTVGAYLSAPQGSPLLLIAGVLCILAAIAASAYAHHRMSSQRRTGSIRGLIGAIMAGCLMGLFYPQLVVALQLPPNALRPALSPYAAVVYFALGLVLSNVVVVAVLCRLQKLTFGAYTHAMTGRFWSGWLGGAIWLTGLLCNVLAADVAGPAVSYALGQCATLIAAIWGIFVWREFRGASRGVAGLLAVMFALYIAGLTVIGFANG